MSRPKGSKNKPTKPQGDEMPKDPQIPEAPKLTVIKTNQIPPTDGIGARKDACPWCNYENDDEMVGLVHKKESSLVRNTGRNYQCDTCGKYWERSALGKPWSIELERGPQWVRETRARELREV